MNINGSITQEAQGMMRWQVVNEDGSIASESPDWQKNLILNTGMDSVGTRSWADQFVSCVASTGSTATLVDGGATTLTQAGQTVLASGAFFASGDVGATIKFTTGGQDATITAFISTTNVTVNISQTVSATTFQLFQTNQTISTFNGANEERTNTYLTGAGNCGTSFFGVSTIQMRRTYDFATRATPKTYTEIGLAWSNTAASNTIFSRILVQGGGVLVQTSQKLRIIYQLNLTVGPTAPRALATTVVGWPFGASGPASAVEQLQLLSVTQVAVNGTSGASDNSSGCNDPHNVTNKSFFLSSTSAAPSTFNSNPPTTRVIVSSGSKAATISPAYVNGTYYIIKTAAYATGEANVTNLRSFGLGDIFGPENSLYGYIIVWDNNQEKPNTHTLTLNIRWSWTRVLA